MTPANGTSSSKSLCSRFAALALEVGRRYAADSGVITMIGALALMSMPGMYVVGLVGGAMVVDSLLRIIMAGGSKKAFLPALGFSLFAGAATFCSLTAMALGVDGMLNPIVIKADASSLDRAKAEILSRCPSIDGTNTSASGDYTWTIEREETTAFRRGPNRVETTGAFTARIDYDVIADARAGERPKTEHRTHFFNVVRRSDGGCQPANPR
jgi:hypothetical protein